MLFIKTLEEFLNESKVKSDEKIDILRDEKYIVVQPLTHRASCKYGAYTKWCISVPTAEYVWSESSDSDNLPYIVVFIIQRNYQNPNNEVDIERLIYLNDIIQNGYDNGDSINEEDHGEYLELFASHNGEDLSKIALIFTNKNRTVPEIWDNNNINLNDVYNSYFDLPIDNYVLERIEEYVENFKYNNDVDLNESISKQTNIILSKEVIDYVNRFESSEQLLRSGGLPIEYLDRLAFGFSSEDIKNLDPKQLHIKWKEDLANVRYEVMKSGLTPKQWSLKIDLSEPIEVSYEKDKFYVEDGHHRYFAAKTLNVPLNVELTIKQNPILKLAPKMGYDDFHRYIFNQVHNETTI